MQRVSTSPEAIVIDTITPELITLVRLILDDPTVTIIKVPAHA